MKNKILFILALLFGLMFINAGLNKFLNYMPPPEELPETVIKDFQAMVEVSWLLPLVAFAEIAGGLFIIFPKTRAIGALVIIPILTGILLNHIMVDTTGLPIALVLTAILIWIIIENKNKYSHLV